MGLKYYAHLSVIVSNKPGCDAICEVQKLAAVILGGGRVPAIDQKAPR
jgi:hypothetical protein